MNSYPSALTSSKGRRIALCDVAVVAVLRDLLAEVTVTQTYRNDEPTNIEAVYTFPLPLDAVLLDLEIDLGGRVLKGAVVEKKAAEDDYEDAVAAGDAAVMLETVEPGLYTMNVGNLLPQEIAKISFRYAILYRWTGDRLRFFLPTTIAPRYGVPVQRPHQAPEISLTVENQFALRVEITGTLCDAQFDCPSHPVELLTMAAKTVVALQQPQAVMDRDFILNVRAPHAARSFALCGQDGDGTTAIAGFQPFFPGLRRARALTLALVVDCSGSMAGASMAQAKQALNGILERLQPEDRITLIAFGTRTRALAREPIPCTPSNLAQAQRFTDSLDADLGGTEIDGALREAYAALAGTAAGEVFLITDGQVTAWRDVVDGARHSGHRVFAVGVGTAVSEAFLRGLAAATGGACEFVAPAEDMAERVVRHFERVRAPRATRATVRWPDGATDLSPRALDAVFDGDTVVACASFARSPAGELVALEIETAAGEIERQELLLPATTPADGEEQSTVARLAAASRLREEEPGAGLRTALRYRLSSPWTNWLVRAPRNDDERTVEPPALRKIPQTLAAGWGGTGRMSVLDFDARAMRSRVEPYAARSRDDFCASMPPPKVPASPGRRLLTLIAAEPARLASSDLFELLVEAELADAFDEVFCDADELGLDVELIAALVVAGLLRGPLADYVAPHAIAAARALRKRANEVTKTLKKIARHGTALAALLQTPAASELQPLLDGSARERLAKVATLLRRLEDALAAVAPEREERESTAGVLWPV